MKILQLTVHFAPNVGGVETHLSDLVDGLVKKKHDVFVLAYQPLTTKVNWSVWQNFANLKILRIPWIPGLFYRLVDKPLLEFLYLLPGLFVVTPFVIFNYSPEVIHAHGLVAGFIGTFWGKAFNKRVVISTHSIYHFPSGSLYTRFVKAIFSRADKILTLSEQSRAEVINLGIKSDKVDKFTYWIDLKKFRPMNNKQRTINNIGIKKDDLMVFFVGRLVEEKGILEALRAAEMWDESIHLVIAGEGPLKEKIKVKSKKSKNIHFLGRVVQDELPDYYSAADIVLVPSTHEEGFGRVILEAFACGTPVVAAKRGAIPEAMSEEVGRLIKVNPKNIKKDIERLYNDEQELKRLSGNAREFAERRYSIRNLDKIISAYNGYGK